MNTTRNATLLREIADKIETHPERHHQESWATGVFNIDSQLAYGEGGPSDWFVTADGDDIQASDTPSLCGTAHCIAGWAMRLAGWTVVWRTEDDGWYLDWIDTNGNVNHTPNHANIGARLLGLDVVDAAQLFSTSWGPPAGMTVPDALRAIADGADIDDVTRHDWDDV